MEMATQGAVPAAPFVPENDENAPALQSKVKASQMGDCLCTPLDRSFLHAPTIGMPLSLSHRLSLHTPTLQPSSSTAACAAAQEARVLRPSSRQDLDPVLPADPVGKSGSSQLMAPVQLAEQAEGGQAAGRQAGGLSVAAGDASPEGEGEGSLALLLARAAEQQGLGEAPAPAAGDEEECAAREERGISSDGLEACPVELAVAGSTEVEDVEAAAVLAEVRWIASALSLLAPEPWCMHSTDASHSSASCDCRWQLFCRAMKFTSPALHPPVCPPCSGLGRKRRGWAQAQL